MSYAVRNGKVVRRARPVALPELGGPTPDHVDLSGSDQVTLAGTTIGYPGIGARLRATLAHAAACIAERHGPAAFACTKHAAAIHEAGHATLYAVDGLELGRAYIEETASGWTGMCVAKNGGWKITPDAPSAELIKRARHLLAGWAAERLFDADFRMGSSLDEIVVSQFLAALAADDGDGAALWVRHVHHPVKRCLVEHQQAVTGIAEYLFEHERLDGADDIQRLTAAVRRADQTPPREGSR